MHPFDLAFLHAIHRSQGSFTTNTWPAQQQGLLSISLLRFTHLKDLGEDAGFPQICKISVEIFLLPNRLPIDAPLDLGGNQTCPQLYQTSRIQLECTTFSLFFQLCSHTQPNPHQLTVFLHLTLNFNAPNYIISVLNCLHLELTSAAPKRNLKRVFRCKYHIL